MLRPFALVLLGLILIACSDPAPPAPPPPPVTKLRIDLLCNIAKNPNTHLALLSDGTVMYVQESDGGKDVAYAFSSGSAAAATHLTWQNILSVIGFSSGTGAIQAICESGDNIYFYFCGQSNRTLVACVGKYFPSTGEIKILADTQSLQELTGAGASLSICHASMATSGQTIWIFIRGIDQSAFLQLDPALGVVRRDFAQLTCDIMPIQLDHDAYDIGGNPDGSLLVTDLWLGVLWRINPDGQLLLQRNLIGLPSQISTPAVDEQGRIMLFVSPSPELNPRLNSSESQRILTTTFPAMLAIEPHEVTIYAGGLIESPGVDVSAVKVSTLTASPDHKRWAGFDATTGQVMRMTFVQGM